MVTRVIGRRELRRKLLVLQARQRARRLHVREAAQGENPQPLIGERLAARPCAIHVATLGQRPAVWQPVEADYLGGGCYRIVDSGERDGSGRLQFKVGQIVRCELSPSLDGERLLAISRA